MVHSGDSKLAVSFDLPPGWVELPSPSQRGRGLLRRSPYESLARRLVSSGAVIKPLVGATARYLERVAAADPTALAVATLVQAPSREEHTFITFVVFPGPPAGVTPLEELAARRGDGSESEHQVRAVDLPWGRAARATYTRSFPDGGEQPFVQYWVEAEGLDQVVITLGDIEAPPGASIDAYISDIDGLTRTLMVKRPIG